MDSFFGIGLPELIFILLIAGLVMGPQRIRQVARILGRLTAQLQRVSREFTRQLNAELDAVDSGEMKGALTDVKSLQREVEALRKELSQVPRSLRDQGEALVSEGKQVISEAESAMTEPSSSKDTGSISQEGDDERKATISDEADQRTDLPSPLDIPGDPEV